MIELLVEASMKTLLVAGFAVAFISLARIRNPAFRHRCWSLVLVAMLVGPLVAWLTPKVQLFTVELPAEPSGTIPALVVEALSTGQDPGRAIPFVVLGIAALLLARTALGYWLGRQLITSARVIPSALLRDTQSGIRYLESSKVRVPLSFGWLRPAILLPESFRSWSPEKTTMVLAHEHEHIRRHDFVVGLLASTARDIYWFNPLSWWLERRLAALAEEATDDVAARTNRRGYARTLVELADEMGPGRVRALAVADAKGVTRRVRRLLDDRNVEIDRKYEANRPGLWATAIVGVTLATLLATFDIGHAAKGVMTPFSNEAPGPEIGIALQDPQSIESLRNWLSAGQNPAIITEDERNEFLRLTTDEERFAFIERFWFNANQVEPGGGEPEGPEEESPQEEEERPTDGVPDQEEADGPFPVSPSFGNDDVTVTMPVVLEHVEPRYTEEAREAGIEGTVILAVVIDQNGSVEVERVVRGIDPGMNESAIEALSRWRFRPATRNGEPVDVALNVEVNFSLREDTEDGETDPQD